MPERVVPGGLVAGEVSDCEFCDERPVLLLESENGDKLYLCREHVKTALTTPNLLQETRDVLNFALMMGMATQVNRA